MDMIIDLGREEDIYELEKLYDDLNDHIAQEVLFLSIFTKLKLSA